MGRGQADISNAAWLRNANPDHPRLSYTLQDGSDAESRILEVSLGKTNIKEKGSLYPSPYTELWISAAYDDAEDIAASLNLLFSQAPERLRGAAKRTFILGAYAPKEGTGLTGGAGAACVENHELFVWRVAKNDDRPGLRQDILNHELAHAAGYDGGPPRDLQDAWEEARELDKGHTAHLASSLSDGESSCSELTVANSLHLLLGSSWITLRAESNANSSEGISEDWACAVQLYIDWGRIFSGGQLRYGDRAFTFADLYPHRARLIAAFLASAQ